LIGLELRKNFTRQNGTGWSFGKISKGETGRVEASEKFQKHKMGQLVPRKNFTSINPVGLGVWKNFRRILQPNQLTKNISGINYFANSNQYPLLPIFISDFLGAFHFSISCIIYSFRIG
jgi:hypothetical protein